MSQDAPELAAHKEWLGQIQQVGLVVSPHVLVRHNVFVDRQKSLEVQAALSEHGAGPADQSVAVGNVSSVAVGLVRRSAISDGSATPAARAFPAFATAILDWPADLLLGRPDSPPVPATLDVALTEHDEVLSADYAVPDPEQPDALPLALVKVLPGGTDFDKLPAGAEKGWRATPHARCERLLRDTKVPIGLLFNGTDLRLLYAPAGESSGHLTFRLKELVQTMGRPMAGALHALLGEVRVTDALPEAQRLPALLRESRKYQNEVSTQLADQVLEALWELVRGFQRANEEAGGVLLAEVLREQPNEVYGGLLSTLMRLVFVLYAEDRALMPAGDTYQKHYAISGLFERLREDEARFPDTMDARYGAWAQLLALFRLIHDGGSHGALRFTARHGRLFDPDAYPFLEGRPHGNTRVKGQTIDAPKVSDGVVFRVLRNLLILDGERLSYRTLDVEQIGSVYEDMMGFALRQAATPAVAVTPKHIVFSVADLLAQKPKDRAAWLQKETELKLAGDGLAKAGTEADVLAALGRRVSRYTPNLLRPGALYLQPTEERRRSGSHYTPRSLTAPIVETTFRPIFERLGEDVTPDQILDLKVCDPAMGSGAFLVEACRFLAQKLVTAWERHKATPKDIPLDEDPLTYARRLVAERCLYGVDRNIFAVDLAKLSLWLATLAKDHPFTFLDHSLRHGDSLVGLSREQIACFNWETSRQLPLLRDVIDERVAEAQSIRQRIQAMASSDDVPEKARLLRESNRALADVRRLGDLVIAAFFEREKPKERQTRLATYWGLTQAWVDGRGPLPDPDDARVTFHWEVEYPEVFTRENPGFDAFVGNPPFVGGVKISGEYGAPYLDWLHESWPRSAGQADVVAFFFRRAYDLMRTGATSGLVGTNTIGQGDTRDSGLSLILESGGSIFSATKRLPWPGAAAVVVSVVHMLRGHSNVGPRLDGRGAKRISAFLLEGELDRSPAALNEHGRKRAFLGSMVAGVGFTFDDRTDQATSVAELQRLLAVDPRNHERVFPFIGGEEINTSPTQSHHRWIIDFGDFTLPQAESWPDLLAIVREKVKPYRDTVNRQAHRQRWWQYGDRRVELYRTLQGMQRTLALSQVSPHLSLAFVPSRCVFSHAVDILAFESDCAFSVLQSRIHEIWARMFGSSMKDDLRYTPSDCFDTFPFPHGWEVNETLSMVGAQYYGFRARVLVQNDEGLTKTYNRFHDPAEQHPDVVRLRELHAAMDRAVLDAYGWTDLQPTCEFLLDYEDEEEEQAGKASTKKKPWRYRWPDEFRDEVLGRLLALNAERAAAGR
jgi:hypothetical protein